MVQVGGVLTALHPVASRLCAWGAACKAREGMKSKQSVVGEHHRAAFT